ncbi:MAG: hypothetical protein IJS88_01160 [Alphaproteobacteria bacterium]|nr:hypothetical protein [Alphaproteobacteria bacterium]
MQETYKNTEEYDKQIKEVRSRIKEMLENKNHRYGGAISDWQMLEYDLQKDKVFAEATHIAKEQKKEDVVQRMIKSAKGTHLWQRMLIEDNRRDMMVGYIWSAIIIGGGTVASAPVVTACGAVAFLGTLGYCLRKNKELTQSQKDLTALQEYVKSSDLQKAVNMSQKNEKPSIKSQIIERLRRDFIRK